MAPEVDVSHVLASGVEVDALKIPPALAVEPAGATCGVRVRGLDLGAELPGEQVFALRQLADHAGYVVVEDQEGPLTEQLVVLVL